MRRVEWLRRRVLTLSRPVLLCVALIVVELDDVVAGGCAVVDV